jgi:hypothetical protein
MRTHDRLKLDAARRVLDFYGRNPEADPAPATVAALARLKEQVARAESALAEQRCCQEGAAQALADRDAIAEGLKPQVACLFRLASLVAEHEGLAELRSRVRLSGVPRTSRAAIEAAHEIARAYQDRLLTFGMPRNLPGILSEGLERYREADHRRARYLVGALVVAPGAAIAAREAHLTIRHLDALKRLSLANDPARLSLWKAACSVRWNQLQESDATVLEA